jgi:cation diffusion facilitator CzcD-associated flavoprotein CzcO
MGGEMPVLDTTDTAHERTPVVAVVGGGCAGTLVAANLLRRAGGGPRGPLV